VNVDEPHVGAAMELLGLRGGEVQKIEQRVDRMHIECEIPARGLIGLRSRMLTATAGEAVIYHCFQKYAPIRTTMYRRANGVLIATAPGNATTYSMLSISQRGMLFVNPQEVIYTGQIVGENSRDNDLDVNITKNKAFSNVRESNKEATVVLKASREITLEVALEYIQDDELVEITPDDIRLRKKELSETNRKQVARRKQPAEQKK
jgi:GTP-binding protein